jgi:C-terminal processing protease CtpA/Prc
VLTINGQPAAHLRRGAAQALLDDSDEATNTLGVLAPGGKAVVVDLHAEPVPTLLSEILPGPFGLLRWDSFGRPDVVEQVRAALTSFEQASVRGWIIDMRWNTGGVSSEVSRLLLDRGRIFSRLRHNEVRSPDGSLIAMREDIDANGTALPFQRPLIILTGPGSMSGAESFAGPLQARGRATLVGERTAGLCGGAHHVVLAPGWEVWITAWETVFDAAEQRVNRIGVTPDVIVTPRLEDEAAGRDPQLDAALDILRRQTATH